MLVCLFFVDVACLFEKACIEKISITPYWSYYFIEYRYCATLFWNIHKGSNRVSRMLTWGNMPKAISIGYNSLWCSGISILFYVKQFPIYDKQMDITSHKLACWCHYNIRIYRWCQLPTAWLTCDFLTKVVNTLNFKLVKQLSYLCQVWNWS